MLALVALFVVYACDDNSKIRKLRRDVRDLQKNASAHLVPGAADYQALRHSLGSVTLSLESVEAHEKGSLITLVVGNLTSVHLTGATLTISYQDYPDRSIERSLKYEAKQTFEAGKGTKARVVLEGVPPAEVSYIRVSNFEPTGIRLIQGK